MYTIGHHMYLNTPNLAKLYRKLPRFTGSRGADSCFGLVDSFATVLPGWSGYIPETNGSPLKIGDWEMNRLPFGARPTFMGQAVSCGENNIPETQMLHWEMEKWIGRVLSL